MIKTFLCAIIFTLSLPAHAEKTFCNSVAELANNTMEMRQMPLPIRKVLVLGSGISSISKESKKQFELILTRAYAAPLYGLKENKRVAISEFESEIYLMCVKEDWKL